MRSSFIAEHSTALVAAPLLVWCVLSSSTGQATARGSPPSLSAEASDRVDEPLRILQVRFDPPTLHTLGVQMLVAGDT
jgi:hypothetical protein